MKPPRFAAVAVLCMAALPLSVRAQPPTEPTVTLPAELRIPPGRMLKLHAETDGERVCWALAASDADLVPFPDGKVALFCSPKPGRYVVLAWTAKANVPSEAARCTIIVGDDPAPPTPVDPFTTELQKLYTADASAEKRTHLAQLAALYREAVKFADSTSVKTAGDLAARIRSASASLLPRDALTTIRHRIAEEIAKHLPLDGEQPLDAALRRTAAQLFDRIATSLETVK